MGTKWKEVHMCPVTKDSLPLQVAAMQEAATAAHTCADSLPSLAAMATALAGAIHASHTGAIAGSTGGLLMSPSPPPTHAYFCIRLIKLSGRMCLRSEPKHTCGTFDSELDANPGL